MNKDYAPLYIPFEKDHGLFTTLGIIITNICFCLNLLYIGVFIFFNFRRPGLEFSWNPSVTINKRIIDIHILIIIIINILFLFIIDVCKLLVLIATIYTLINILGITLREFIGPIINKNEKGNYLMIRDSVRWFVYAFVNVFLIILSFAVIYLKYGDQFYPTIQTPIDAIYHSIMTFTTLGYGDIHPICQTGKILVIFELIYFIIFLLGKLPIAVSVIRVEVEK